MEIVYCICFIITESSKEAFRDSIVIKNYSKEIHSILVNCLSVCNDIKLILNVIVALKYLF